MSPLDFFFLTLKTLKGKRHPSKPTTRNRLSLQPDCFSLHRLKKCEGEMDNRRAANMILSRANRMKTKLQSSLEASFLEIEDVSHQHAGHAAMKGNTAGETHFNVKIVSPKFDGLNPVKRHRLVYDALAEELQSGLHALSIVAKTPQEEEVVAAKK
ncbi:unnamed protein product [Dovyalis caffra]|uniref:Uncharacterized protein n=2 Tax=Dovyalis caffra TaxID=77055 RepID=A0AAV1R4I2_9ROSI|nr:unnamed protein product [Dovyalis caffra]